MVPRTLVSAACLLATVGSASASAELLLGLAAPLSGPNAWIGDQTRRGAERAVINLNAAGGVLGRAVRMVTADDYCESEQAVAAARKLEAAGVRAVVGHPCSGAAMAAAEVYRAADILMISDGATNPALTDRGAPNVFRVVGRDDRQGRMVGDYLAAAWADARIAILHDGQTYGKGLAQKVRERLNELGVAEAIFEAVTPGGTDYAPLLSRLHEAGIAVAYFGGYAPEAGLILRQAHDMGYDLRLVTGDGAVTEDFWLIADVAAEGTLSTSFTEPAGSERAAAVVAEFRANGYEPVDTTLYSYAAVQVWSKAVKAVGTSDSKAVAETLRSRMFDTVIGTLGFDEKGDVTGVETFSWFVWTDGQYVPLQEAELTEWDSRSPDDNKH